MERRIPITTLFAASLLLAGAAAPAAAKEYEGWVYNGLTGWSTASHSGLDDSAWASNPSIGYRWGAFGVEAGHAWFADFKDSQDVGAVTVETRAKFSGWNAGLNFNHDLDERWALQLRAGLFNWDVEGSVDDGLLPAEDFDDSGNDWYAGASVTFQWHRRASIGLGYSHYKAGGTDLDVWGLQSEYRLGKME